MANVLVTIRTVDDQAMPVPLDDVLVSVYDEAGIFITEGLTGVVTPGSGEFELTLWGDAGGTIYEVRLRKDGVSFPPGNYFEISVTDPAPAPFEFTGHEGSTGELVKVTIKETSGDPIEAARVRFYTSADVFITELLTDAAGELELTLEGDPDPGRQYIIRVLAQGFLFENGPTQTIYVIQPLVAPATNIFDLVADAPEVPASSDPNMCLISGTFANVALGPLKRLRIRFMPRFTELESKVSGLDQYSFPAIVGGVQILNEYVAETDENGYAEVMLPRGGVFDIDVHGYFKPAPPTYYQMYVPDSASARFEDVLFPFVKSVSYDDDTVDLAVGGTQELELTVLGSNDLVIDPSIINCFLEFTSSDPAVMSVFLTEEGKLLVTALAIGTATVQVSRRENTWAERLPDIPALDVTEPTVEVT